MKTQLKITLLVLTLFLATSALADHVNFESLPTGLMFGAPVGDSPGDYLFSENAADVYITNFISGGTPYFHYCSVDPSWGPPHDFHDLNIMQVNNVALVFDFSAPGEVSFEFMDLGGSVNLQVNGSGAVLEGPDLPSLAGTLAPGVTLTVNTMTVPGGHKGTATITGPVQRLRLGGQEFFIDDVRGGEGPIPEDCDHEVTHQSLNLGQSWGSSSGNLPGDFMFEEDGIPVFAEYFHWMNGSGTFGNCQIQTTPEATFGFDQVMAFNNINNVYEISVLGITTSEVRFELLDFGGNENLQVNGGPLFADDITNMPAAVAAGVTMSVSTYPSGGGYRAEVVLTGNVHKLLIGGQEFYVDNVCVVENAAAPPCDFLVDNESRSLGEVWGGPYGQGPGDFIFEEDGIGLFLDLFDHGGTFSFNEVGITNPVCGLLENNAMWLNNIMVVFDLTNVQPVNLVTFEFCDCGGDENLSINGVNWFGEFENAPPGYFGADVNVQVQILGDDDCKYGTVTVTGNLYRVGIGGQELQIDNFCALGDELSGTAEQAAVSVLNLEGNFPNPFNPSTTISFTTGAADRVQLDVIDLAGRRVASLLDGYLEAGRHEVFWNGRDEKNRQAATGIYFLQLRAGEDVASRKITLIK